MTILFWLVFLERCRSTNTLSYMYMYIYQATIDNDDEDVDEDDDEDVYICGLSVDSFIERERDIYITHRLLLLLYSS